MDLNKLKEKILLAVEKDIERLKRPANYKINRPFVFPYHTGFFNCDGDYVVEGPRQVVIRDEKDVRTLIDIMSFLIHEDEMFRRSCKALDIIDMKYKYDYYTAYEWASDVQIRINVLKNEQLVKKMIVTLESLKIKVEELVGIYPIDKHVWKDIKELWPDWWGYNNTKDITEAIGKIK